MILLIDNYDSFTWNLVHLIAGLGHEVEVVRNDQISVDEVFSKKPRAVVLSPGPCTPNEAGICLDLVRAAIDRHAHQPMALFGVCLGLQSIAQAMGGKIIRAPHLMHGKTSGITRSSSNCFLSLLSEKFIATRYHSLVAESASLPGDLIVCARSDDDHEIMAVEHRILPIAAVQFHPESIATQSGAAMFDGFMQWSAQRTGQSAQQRQ